MATHRLFPLIAAAVLGLAFGACRSTAERHFHTATPHHGKRLPSDDTAPSEARR